MSKVKLNQFDELKRRLKEKREAKKPFEARGSLAQTDKPKRAPKPAHDERFFDVKKYDNWLAPASKEPTP